MKKITDPKFVMKFKFALLLLAFPFLSMAQNFSKIDELLDAYAGENPGAALAIIRDGKIVYSKNLGMANLEEKIKVTSKTNFRLASVTKQFTAAAILQLIEKGKLSLQTKLTECFPALPAYAKEISIEQMLCHTSGILDYDDMIDESGSKAQLSDQDVLDACMKFDKTYFSPGSTYRYSNTAYVLLGLVIGKYSGEAYPDYLAEHIFKPLKMNNTIVYVKGGKEIKNRAFGYAKEKNIWNRKDQSSTSATLGDGGIYSNINDLIKWDEALYNNSILPQIVWQSAFTKQKLNDGTAIDYGFGWHLKRGGHGESIVYHTGSTTSFRNIFYRNPKNRLSLLILTNRNVPSEENMVVLAEEVLAAYHAIE
jgi:CubicO group peptidase (beta-lactamase class C family)